MLLLSGILLHLLGAANSKDATLFLGRNPYEWQDTNCILYNYKGFFDPMVDLVKTDTASHWSWDKSINVETVAPSKASLTRAMKTGPVLSKIFELDKEEDLYGIIGVTHSTEGAFGSEICNVTYIHTYSDSDKSMQLEGPGKSKVQIFGSTIRLGPSITFIASGILDFLSLIADENGESLDQDIQIKVIHETSFGSEKISHFLKTITRVRYPTWKILSTSYELDSFSGATSDEKYFFREQISKLDFFEKTCAETLLQARVVVIIGSMGFIRQTAISLYEATAEAKEPSFADFIMISIPSTLWPFPSHKAEDMMIVRSEFVKKSDDETARLAFRNMFVFTDIFNETRYGELAETVKDKFYQDTPYRSSNDWTPKRPVPLWSGYTYDAVLLLMKAMKEVSEPSDFYSFLRNKTWDSSTLGGIHSFSGPIELNEWGDRVWKMNLSYFGEDNEWTPIGKYIYEQGFDNSSMVPLSDIDWSASNSLPRLLPADGYNPQRGWSEATWDLIKIFLIIIGSIIGVMLIAALIYKRHKIEQDLKDLSWRVDFKELTVLIHDQNLASEDGSVIKSASSSSGTNLHDSAKTMSLDSIVISSGERKMFKNMHVFIKPLVGELFGHVFQDIKLMKELKYLKDLQSEYTVNMVGLTLDPLSGYCWLVTEDCQKGNLLNVLEDDTMELDSTLKLSMIDDIAMGMAFIHYKTKIGSHGNLKSTNILVSDNFTMKVSDFGECIFMSDMKKTYHHSEIEYNKRLMWRAPELLRKKYIDMCGTKAGDVYSFAIIIHELINRQGPFNLHSLDNTETPNSVVLKVKNVGEIAENPFRPVFSEKIRNKPLKKISNLVKGYWWHEDPEMRNNFKQIINKLKKVNPRGGKAGSFLDRSVKRMEKFSSALADKAADKEAQVMAETKKVNDLLEYFVPKILIMAGLDNFKSETLPDTTVAVIELAGLTQALRTGTTIQDVVNLETKFRNMFDVMAPKFGLYFGQGNRTHRIWVCSRVTARQDSNHVGTVQMVQEMIQQMEVAIRMAGIKGDDVSVKAGMHTDTIKTGLIGNGEDSAPKFAFLGVYEDADNLCSLSQGFEILVSPVSHKVLQSMTHKEWVLDWSEKQQYEQSGEVVEAYCLKVCS